ncbi:MAG: hypothetical protein R3C59_00980 [Planctomycetaceae bacterium]
MAEGTINSDGLSKEQEELLLDLTQFLLDIIGIFEPTPFADGTNAAISLKRKDWLGAALSAVSILPYVGDLAKLTKLPRYARTINRVISLAQKDAKFAAQVRPLLVNLKKLLDDVPMDELPGSLNQIRRRLSSFLSIPPQATGAVRKAMQTLPSSLKADFLKAMKLPPLKNPRALKKRPGPVKEDSLLAELANKGFVSVKKGQHSARKSAESSDIYIRRIVGEDGKQYFEAIRIDRKFGGGTSRPLGKANQGLPQSAATIPGVRLPGDIQRADKSFRRLHHTLESTSDKVGKAAGGGRTLGTSGRERMVNELQAGSKKGEFSHWHHERIPATPADLARYLQKPLKGKTQKFDNVGQLVGTW